MYPHIQVVIEEEEYVGSVHVQLKSSESSTFELKSSKSKAELVCYIVSWWLAIVYVWETGITYECMYLCICDYVFVCTLHLLLVLKSSSVVVALKC